MTRVFVLTLALLALTGLPAAAQPVWDTETETSQAPLAIVGETTVESDQETIEKFRDLNLQCRRMLYEALSARAALEYSESPTLTLDGWGRIETWPAPYCDTQCEYERAIREAEARRTKRLHAERVHALVRDALERCKP